MTNTTPATPAESAALSDERLNQVIDGLTEHQKNCALFYFAHYAPDAFAAAMRITGGDL
jgi:hypothetical protein